MGTPSKEEHKCDADVLLSKLKSDDSLKENEILSNGIDDNSSVESSVLTEGGDSLHGESNITTSEELKSSNIPDKVETIEDISGNGELNEINVSDDQQQTDISGNESLSSIQQENNPDASSDSNLAMPSTEDLSNNVSADDDFDLKDVSQTENFDLSVHTFSTDIINEDKIAPGEEIQEHVEDVDANNVLNDHNEIVSTSENVQDFVCKSDVNALPESHNPDDNASCDNSNGIISLSEEIQKHSYNPDSNAVIEDSYEATHTCQKAPESDHNPDIKVVENKEMKDTTENMNICEHNFDNTVDEVDDIVPTCGEIPGDTSVSEEVNENVHTHDNKRTVEDGNEILSSEEMQNQDHNSDDNIVDKSISEIKGTSEEIMNNESVDNSSTKEITSSGETLQDDNHSDDIVIKNTSSNSKTDEVSSKIETPSFSEIEKIPEKKRGRKPKRKSCPKIKISVAKKAENSGPASCSKNWYVSERKESTDSTQSEEPLKDNLGGSKRRGRRKMTTNSSLPVNTLSKDERLCFETVAEIHAVDTDTSPSCSKVSSELNVVSDDAISELVNDDASAVSSKMNETCSVVLSTVDLCSVTHANEVSSRSIKSLTKRKSACLKPSTDFPVEIKDEPIDINTNSASDPIVHIKLENEEIVKSMDEITIDTTRLSARKKGRPSSAADKRLKFDVTAAEAPEENQLKIEAIEKSSSKGITDSPSAKPSRKQGTPTSCPKNRKKSYSPEAVIVPFSLGWMRELVHRSTEGKAGKRMSDVYYFSPEGTKLRSMIEISNYLSRHPECTLTIGNFTYWKELVYREPFEIQRSAKQKSVFGTPLGKTETSNQSSIKKFLQSSTTPKSSPLQSSSSKEKPQKKKIKTSISNSAENVDAIENEKSSPVTLKTKKKVEKSANDSNSIMDTVENSDSTGSRPNRKIARKVPFDNSVDEQSQLRPKRGRPSKSLNTSVPEPEITKTVNVMKSQSDSSKSTVAENSSILSKNYSKSTTTKRRPKLKLVFSKNMNS